MGQAPPPNLPPPEPTPGFAAPTETASSLCAFKLPLIPNFLPSFSFPLSGLLPTLPPLPKLPLSINCAQNNPQDVSSGLPYGGGRTSNADPSPDLNEDQP
jgi:hypothetical protein